MEDSKPGIIVISSDTEETFRWLSDGWNEMKKAHTTKARKLMAKAHEAIEAATDTLDAIRRLREAGFKVTRSGE